MATTCGAPAARMLSVPCSPSGCSTHGSRGLAGRSCLADCPLVCRSAFRAGSRKPFGLTVSCVATVPKEAAVRPTLAHNVNGNAGTKGPKVLVAGAGIGGLVLAVGLLKKGFDVQLFERDLTAIRGEGKYRGPIQVQSNALAALEAIDTEVAEQVLARGCITGDRVNGLCDGVTGKWYVKFDTFHPAVERGLPVTRVISRFVLQELLADACRRLGGEDIIANDCHVVDFEEGRDSDGKPRVWVKLEDGRKFEGDVLIGADGIWSKVRKKIVGVTDPSYSQYTCYTGIANFTPPDIDTVGYRVFLGNGQYFVSSDVGDGKMQWYGFHKEPAGGKDVEGRKKQRLLEIFGHWTDQVTDLIKATPEPDVLRRDIYDRPPIFKWAQGRVALLGDSAHAMQPNLGQGGCMAIEDGYQLALDMADALERDANVEWTDVLRAYQNKRILRCGTIHGLAGMAAIMASTYKAYLGEGLGPLSWITKFKIPHPGRVGGYFAMNATMPSVLSWVLGGNTGALRMDDRLPSCRITDKPQGFHEQDFYTFMRDDDALLRAAKARWLLVPSTDAAFTTAESIQYCEEGDPDSSGEKAEIGFLQIALPPGSIEVPGQGLTVGSGKTNAVYIDCTAVAANHATVSVQNGDYYVTDNGTGSGTWLNGKQLLTNQPTRIYPEDCLEFGKQDSHQHRFSVKLCHVSLFDAGKRAASDTCEANLPDPIPALATAESATA